MLEEFTDFLGNKIKVGEEIVFMVIKYRHMRKGKVISITEKTVLIEHKDGDYTRQSRQFHNQIVRAKSSNEETYLDVINDLIIEKKRDLLALDAQWKEKTRVLLDIKHEAWRKFMIEDMKKGGIKMELSKKIDDTK